MLTFIWRIDGFHMVNLMTEQHNRDTYNLLTNIMEPSLGPIFPDRRKLHAPWISWYLDNCNARRSKAFGSLFPEKDIIRVSHPP
jgi:hypothetical protein